MPERRARIDVRRSCPAQKNEQTGSNRDQSPAQPVRGGKRTEIEAVGPNSLDQESPDAVVDQVDGQYIAVVESVDRGTRSATQERTAAFARLNSDS